MDLFLDLPNQILIGKTFFHHRKAASDLHKMKNAQGEVFPNSDPKYIFQGHILSSCFGFVIAMGLTA